MTDEMKKEIEIYIKSNIDKWKKMHKKYISEAKIKQIPRFAPGDICLKTDSKGNPLYLVIIHHFYRNFRTKFGLIFDYWIESVDHIMFGDEMENNLLLERKYRENIMIIETDINKLTFAVKGQDSITFKELLKLICKTVLTEDDWNCKRFIGDSDWLYCIAKPLIENGFVKGKIIDGEVIEVDWNDFDRFITNQLDEFFK